MSHGDAREVYSGAISRAMMTKCLNSATGSRNQTMCWILVREGAKEGRCSCGGGLAGRQYHSGFPSFLFLLCLIRKNSTPAITNKESGEIERWGRCFGSTEKIKGFNVGEANERTSRIFLLKSTPVVIIHEPLRADEKDYSEENKRELKSAQQVEDIIAHGEELPNKKEKSTFEAGGSSSRRPYSPRPFNPNPTPVSKGVVAVATQAPIVITRQEKFAPPYP
ncbi:hypothetical protein NE237_000252 [Protea cynaroides]|uniref:Uncharacterized protein n=1 Tax=Protea cynaroides TaxID=273540 RepID=A0A9Q0KR29_9MAGN|nr:hypothetical protein NE237_000252 [Protea cynaroides]